MNLLFFFSFLKHASCLQLHWHWLPYLFIVVTHCSAGIKFCGTKNSNIRLNDKRRIFQQNFYIVLFYHLKVDLEYRCALLKIALMLREDERTWRKCATLPASIRGEANEWHVWINWKSWYKMRHNVGEYENSNVDHFVCPMSCMMASNYVFNLSYNNKIYCTLEILPGNSRWY